MSIGEIPTPTFCHREVDFSKLLKDRIAKSTNYLNSKEFRKLKLSTKKNLSNIPDKHLSCKSYLQPHLLKKHQLCNYCPVIIFKNIYDRKHMIKFVLEKEKTFEGSELEKETIDNESN